MAFVPGILSAEEIIALITMKVERAHKHVVDLNAAFGSFFATNPYRYGRKTDNQSGKLVYYLERCNPVPLEFACACGDASRKQEINVIR